MLNETGFFHFKHTYENKNNYEICVCATVCYIR